MRWALGHHHSLEQKDARWLNHQVRLTPPTNLRGLTPLLLVSFWGCLVGWGMGGEIRMLLLGCFRFLSPPPVPLRVPTPFPGSEPERGEGEGVNNLG